ncbi:MAG: hypothetical protein LBK00_06700 [Treponema sp.]|jgi:hypothetical protein|nr:hypothetical protein [Treponema sp.]
MYIINSRGINIMELPEYWIKCPNLEINDTEKLFFDSIFENIIKSGKNQMIKYSSLTPKWKFLSYIAKQYPYILHGSGNNNIKTFEPRQPIDLTTFGNQKAVYAAADGIWPIFYAILNRAKYPMSLCSGCIYIKAENEILTGPFYFFSISKNALEQRPYQPGTIYILPKDTFQTQSDETIKGNKIYIPQLASIVEVKPVARIQVGPEDFPFLNFIRGFNESDLESYSNAMARGEPLPQKI